MDTIEEIEQMVSREFHDYEQNLSVPSLSILAEARKKVAARKKSIAVEKKNWYLPEWLFNVRISFAHVAVFVLLLETAVIFKTRQQGVKEGSADFIVSAGSLAAVQNATIVSSSITYNFQ